MHIKFCYFILTIYAITLCGQKVLENAFNLLHLNQNACSEAVFNSQLTSDSFSHAAKRCKLSSAASATPCCAVTASLNWHVLCFIVRALVQVPEPCNDSL